MVDVQKEKPEHEYPVDMAGIRGLKYPIRVLDRAAQHQHTVAEISMSVDLPRNLRGTHMSRFVQILNEYSGDIAYEELKPILEKMRHVFDAKRAHLSICFPYFVEKSAPVSGKAASMEYTAFFNAEISDKYKFELGVKVPITTLCPCSKEISARGAHNQRAIATLRVRFNEFLWIEELIDYAERSASSPVYAILKRADEKYVTEKAYDNPRFVEDVVRSLAQMLINDTRIDSFRVEAESIESIHNHNAYAAIEYPGKHDSCDFR